MEDLRKSKNGGKELHGEMSVSAYQERLELEILAKETTIMQMDALALYIVSSIQISVKTRW